MKKMIVLILITILTGTAYAKDNKADEFPVISYNNLDVTNFNIQLSSAAQKGEDWASRPFLIIQKYRPIGITGFSKIIVENDNGGEDPLRSTITVIEDGYYDDSVRGTWWQFHLERASADSIWEVKEIRKAYSCWRGQCLNAFSKEMCP